MSLGRGLKVTAVFPSVYISPPKNMITAPQAASSADLTSYPVAASSKWLPAEEKLVERSRSPNPRQRRGTVAAVATEVENMGRLIGLKQFDSDTAMKRKKPKRLGDIAISAPQPSVVFKPVPMGMTPAGEPSEKRELAMSTEATVQTIEMLHRHEQMLKQEREMLLKQLSNEEEKAERVRHLRREATRDGLEA